MPGFPQTAAIAAASHRLPGARHVQRRPVRSRRLQPRPHGARSVGAAALGLAVVALEAWLRVPVRPLLDGYLQEAQARVAAFVRHLSF